MAYQRCVLLLLLCLSVLGCGGSGSESDQATVPSTPATPTPAAPGPISNLALEQITATSVKVSFQTPEPVPVEITIVPIGASDSARTIQSPAATEHSQMFKGLWADVEWQVTVSVADNSESTRFKTLEPGWPSNCRTGNLKLPIMPEANWQTYTDLNGAIQVATSPGCDGEGHAAQFSFDLNNGEWVVAARSTAFETPIDLTAYSHLWVPFRGEQGVPVALEVKLKDSAANLAFVRLDGGAGLPVWRSWAVDLREFQNQIGTLDLSNITSLEFAFSWPSNLPGKRQGSVQVGDIWAWHIDDVRQPIEELEAVLPDISNMALVAQDLLTRQQPHGFIPAWFELTPNWHLYANAMALIVFTLEYERLAGVDGSSQQYLLAANKLADELIRLQALSDRNGAWDDSFNVSNNRLVLKPANERVMWVGSTAWAGIALIIAREVLPDASRFDQSIANAANYFQTSQQCRESAGLPDGSITEGTEGNISSHLFWHAAVARGLAEPGPANRLKTFIEQHLFDPVQQRFFCGVQVDIGDYNEQACTMTGTGNIIAGHALACLDVAANWGSQWLKRQNRLQDALAGLAFGMAIFPTQGFTATSIKGLGDIAGPWSPTVEHGAGQWAAEGGINANFIINQAKQQLCQDGRCQGAANDFSAGIGWNTTANGIAPAAWMYLAWHGGFWQKL